MVSLSLSRFFYENGKLVKLSEVFGNKRIFTDFSYDNKGRILKEKRYQDDQLVLSTVDYKYTSDKNYTTKKWYLLMIILKNCRCSF